MTQLSGTRSALNRIDVIQRAGTYTVPGSSYRIGGLDIAGEIVCLGANAAKSSSWQIGDRVVVNPSLSNVGAASTLCNRGDLYGELGVIGINAPGGHAEMCVVPTSHLYPIPESMPFNTAAVFPTAWMTAHHALFAVGKLQHDEILLIHAAASGVSSAAINWQKLLAPQFSQPQAVPKNVHTPLHWVPTPLPITATVI